MNTWVTANHKEGAGKTAKWVPLAFAFAERGLRKTGTRKAATKIRAIADYSDHNMESHKMRNAKIEDKSQSNLGLHAHGDLSSSLTQQTVL
ncbi:MAG: hypothetical protein WC856_28175 [Methylococcaceae bacterium]|jgi:hypothetical protein